MQHETDPTEDINELSAVIRSNDLELDLIDQWLSGLDQAPDKTAISRKLLELRSLCQIRTKLLRKIEAEYFSVSGVA